jgi:hypothetical protein
MKGFIVVSMIWFALGGLTKLICVVKDQYPRPAQGRGYDAGDAIIDFVMLVWGGFAFFY